MRPLAPGDLEVLQAARVLATRGQPYLAVALHSLVLRSAHGLGTFAVDPAWRLYVDPAVLATWCAGLYQDWLSGSDALLIGVAVGLAGPLGDLFESQVKRDSGVKDTGKAFGAHGGALDRLDAAFFTLVAGYYVWLALL